MHKPIPLIIVAGYLGAGKTSLVRHLLPVFDATNKKGLLLVNEAGDINIDGAMLGNARLEQLELLGGCACCSMRGDLFASLMEGLDTYNPDYIVLESSGLADPAELIDAATADPLPSRLQVTDVVVVVDAANLEQQLRLSKLAQLQLRFASAVVLNKLDTVTPRHAQSLQEKLRLAAPEAPLYTATNGLVDPQALLARSFTALAGGNVHAHTHDHKGCATGCQHPDHKDEHGHGHHHHATHGHYALNIELKREVTNEQLLQALALLPPDAYRVKGFVRVTGSARPWIFQRVGGLPAQATPFVIDTIRVPIGMVVIGPRLTEEKIRPSLELLGGRVIKVTG